MTIAYDITSASHTHSSSVTEQTVFTLTPSSNNMVKGIWLDTTNLTQNTTIRVKYTVDGTNFRTFQSVIWNTGMDDGVLIEGDIPVAEDYSLRLTLESGTVEGSEKSVPYQYFTEGLGSNAVTYTYTVTSSVDGSVLTGVEVWVTSDSAGDNIVASGITNSSGQIVFFLSNSTTYYFWRKSSLYTFTNPDSEVISV